MNYQTIDEIYEANDRIRASLKEALATLTEQQVAARPEDEKWSIAEIVEHVSMVGNSLYRICAKLLSKAEASGQLSAGSADLSAFALVVERIADVKLEAPEFVHPTGTKSVAESIAELDEIQTAVRGLKPLFEKYDSGSFPHPYFGELTAVEWLALVGVHEGRHLRQIKGIIEIGAAP
jgi:hypothetical protein